MNDSFETKLEHLGFHIPEWCLSSSEALVREYEKRFSLKLPGDYRNFLVRFGGFFAPGGAVCPYQEPTPCGNEALIDRFYGFTSPDRSDNVIYNTELIDGYPDVVAIGDNLMGGMIWLKCIGRGAGCMYMHDHEGRSAWPEEMFSRMFPNLSPEIKDYLELRRQGQLPRKPKGYEHVYQIATSFTDFINRLQKARNS